MLGSLKINIDHYNSEVNKGHSPIISQRISESENFKWVDNILNDAPVFGLNNAVILNKYLSDQDFVGRISDSIRLGGSVFIIGLMAMQTLVPLPTEELAVRLLLAGWTLLAFSTLQSPGRAMLLPGFLIQMLAMLLFSFSSVHALAESQLAIDAALVGAGWVALFSRWYLLFKAARLRTIRADIEMERHRHRILSTAAAR